MLIPAVALLFVPQIEALDFEEAPSARTFAFDSTCPGYDKEVGRAEGCDLDNDGLVDLLMQRGDEIVGAIGAAAFGSVVTVVPGDVSSYAVYPGWTPTGGDGVIVTTGTGYSVIGWDASSAMFVGTSTTDGDWADALFVRSGDVNGDGLLDLAGVASDAHTVLFSLGQSNGSFAAATTTTLVPTILACELANFRVSLAGLELVLATTSGLRVMSYTGLPFVAKAHNASPNEALGIVEMSGPGLEDVVIWLTGVPQLLLTVIDNGTQTPTLCLPATMPRDTYVTVSTGDVWPEVAGIEAICNSPASSTYLIIPQEAPNGVGFPPYDLANAVEFDYSDGQPSVSNESNVVVADLDGDTMIDIALPTENRERLDLWLGGDVPGASKLTTIPIGDMLAVIGDETALWDAEIEDPDFSKVHIEVFPPESTDHYRVIVWSQPDETGTADPEALNSHDAPVQETFEESGITYIDVIVPRDDSYAYWFSLQPRDSSDAALDRWLSAAFAEQPNRVTQEGNYHVDPVAEAIELATVDLGGSTGGAPDKTASPAFVHTSRIASFPLETIPNGNVTELSTGLPDHESLASLGSPAQ